MNNHGLTPREELFCREYVIDMSSATAAAIRAGYARSSASQTAVRLLGRLDINLYIAELLDPLFKRAQLSAQMVMDRYNQMLNADRRGIVDEHGRPLHMHELPEDLAACIDGFKYDKDGRPEYKFVSRRAVARDVGEMFSLFKTIAQHDVTVGERTIDPEKLDDETLAKILAARKKPDGAQ